jgi:hypothetical protein
MSKNKNVLRVILYVLFFVLLFMYALFHGSKYDWMDSLDPARSHAGVLVEDDSSNRSVFRGVILALVIAVQLIIVSRCSRLEAALTAASLALTVIAFW